MEERFDNYGRLHIYCTQEFREDLARDVFKHSKQCALVESRERKEKEEK